MKLKIGLGVALVLAGLAVLRFKPWKRSSDPARPTLEVGFLPVT